MEKLLRVRLMRTRGTGSKSMFKNTVEMYGISPHITPVVKVEVELNEGGLIPDVIAALKAKIPALEGPVIQSGYNRLSENYAFIINGQFHMNEDEVKVQPGDRIVLVLLAVGG
jgi:hypothetical protein